MTFATIGVVSMGDMGHAVARTLKDGGYHVLTALNGRSERTRALAATADIEDAGALDELVEQTDLILSILPPAAAPDFAQAVADSLSTHKKKLVFVDANAIAPATTRAIGEVVGNAGATFVDGSIIGAPPGRRDPTRLYVSGPDAGRIEAIARPDMLVRNLGSEIGAASGIKMCYAALTKGTMTLDTLVLLAARSLGLSEPLMAEFGESQSTARSRMERSVPWLAADAARWVGEMEEIARTFADAGFTRQMHEGAADVFRLLAQSELAAETRETANRERSLDDALDAFFAASPSASGRDAAN